MQDAQVSPLRREGNPRLALHDGGARPLPLFRRMQVPLLAGAGAAAARIVGPTLRFEVLGERNIERVHASGRRCIYAFWHHAIFLVLWWWRGRGAVAMTSGSFDGQVLARAMEQMGFGTVHGSSSRGGLRALALLARELEAGRDAVLFADGPRGPRYAAKAGAAILARRTGNPVVCVEVRAERAHIFEKSWDRFQLPHPFSRVVVVISPPVEVPAVAGRGVIEAKQAEIQGLLDRAAKTAESWFTLPVGEREHEAALWNG